MTIAWNPWSYPRHTITWFPMFKWYDLGLQYPNGILQTENVWIVKVIQIILSKSEGVSDEKNKNT